MKKILFLLFSFLLLSAITAKADFQYYAIGQVVDENDEPVICATVRIKGTTIGAPVDGDGVFIIPIPNFPVTLVIDAVGYCTKELLITEPQDKYVIGIEFED